MQNTVKPAFALALYGEFLTLLSRPLGAPDIFSGACRPSQTTKSSVVFYSNKKYSFQRIVFHYWLHNSLRNYFDAYYLHWTSKTIFQRQSVVNLRGVFSSRWTSAAYSLRSEFVRFKLGTLGISLSPWCKPTINRQGITLP